MSESKGGTTERQRLAMAALVRAIEADVAAKRGSVVPPSRRPTYEKVLAAKAELRAALMETACD